MARGENGSTRFVSVTRGYVDANGARRSKTNLTMPYDAGWPEPKARTSHRRRAAARRARVDLQVLAWVSDNLGRMSALNGGD